MVAQKEGTPNSKNREQLPTFLFIFEGFGVISEILKNRFKELESQCQPSPAEKSLRLRSSGGHSFLSP